VRLANDAPLLFDITRLIWRRWAGRHPTGIDRVCLAYLEQYGKAAQAVIQHRRIRRILDRQSSARLFDILGDSKRRVRPSIIDALIKSAISEKCSGNGRFYLNIGHTGLDDPGFEKWVGGADVRSIYLVHDLIPITHPEYCRAGEQFRHERRMRTVLATAAGVIGNSQATIDELAAFSAAEGTRMPPAVAAWLGTPDLSVPPAKIESSRPTFVVLGTIEARKNHLMLLRIWDRLIERLGSKAPQLLIIGQRGWECQDVFDLLDRDETLKIAVEEIGDCSDEAMTGHLASARALLFPSLIEGYGLPLIEALQLGTPVIASDLPVFREIGQGTPDFLDPLNQSAWERMILSYAGDESEHRSAQLSRLASFRAPTWANHFAKIDSWLSEL
jgi:glycosyltransferase involved in cell wall biosynthesis